ncbi:MAG: TIGR03936 family radical SAM-associated protein [Oscillospiraceae bacterium]|jgi:radical SAM-linked protein|nr:TIGR03936 family radical SAM-associated protein [Oscillospiraceae bacterium]
MFIAFEKTFALRHIGHLDLLRVMQRALRRADLPVAYSQGFNPHMLISFASPLPVGQSGREELADVTFERPLSEKDCLTALRAALPPGLPPVRVRTVEDNHSKLMAMLRTASYVVRADDAGALASAIPAFLHCESIPAVRVSKSGSAQVDIRPMLHELKYIDMLSAFHTRVSFTERETLKPDLLMQTLAKFACAEEPDMLIERVRLFGENRGSATPLIYC